MTRTSVPALPGSPSASVALDELTGAGARIAMIPLDRLHSHPDNPRRDVGDVTELADSIRAHGVRQNLLVVPDPDDPDAYRLVIGHRRTAAARAAGTVAALPAVVDDTLTPADQLQLMLLENLQRVDLTAVEEADAYQGLLDLGLDEKAIAQSTGRARSTVKSRLRLRGLPEKAREAVHQHVITLEDAAALDALPAAEQKAAVKTIGTPNFRSAIARVQHRLEIVEKARPILTVLAAANATELPRDEYDAPEGLAVVSGGSLRIEGVSAEEIQRCADELAPQLTAGSAWRWWYEYIRVYRPLTLEEAQERAEASERIAKLDAEREAREAAAATARAQREEFARVTAATRREFLEHLVHARKTLTKDQQASLLDYAATVLIAAPWSDRWVDGVFVRAAHEPRDEALVTWLHAEFDGNLKSLGYSEREEALRAPVETAASALAAPQRLLAALAAAVEPIAEQEWLGAHRAEHVVRWYALLEQLGYTPSDAERAGLAGPVDDPGVPA